MKTWVQVQATRSADAIRLGDSRALHGPGQFIAPHGIPCDSQGSLDISEVWRLARLLSFPVTPVPDPPITLQNLVMSPEESR